MTNLEIGKMGEQIAAKYLQSRGYQIITKNFKCKTGEIDLIGIDHNVLIFIEVKTRINQYFGRPEEAVTSRKIQSITKTAQYFKMLHPELPEALRIDVVAILMSPDGTVEEIKLIKNASE